MISRINLLVLVLVVLSALYLVRIQFNVRSLFIEQDQTTRQTKQLNLQRNQLDVQERELTSASRIEQIASGQLQMRHIDPRITIYLNQGQVVNTAPEQVPPPAGGKQ